MVAKEIKLKVAEAIQDDVNKGSVNQRFTGLYLLDKIKVNK